MLVQNHDLLLAFSRKLFQSLAEIQFFTGEEFIAESPDLPNAAASQKMNEPAIQFKVRLIKFQRPTPRFAQK